MRGPWPNPPRLCTPLYQAPVRDPTTRSRPEPTFSRKDVERKSLFPRSLGESKWGGFGLPISSLAHCEVADSSLQLVRVEPCIDTRTVRCPISLRGLKHKTGNGELDIRISPRYLHMQNVNEWMIVHRENLTVRAFSREHTN